VNGGRPGGGTSGGDLPGGGAPDARQDSPQGPPTHVMEPIERMVSRVLRSGIVIAVALMAVGLALSVVDQEGMPSHVVPLADIPPLLGELDPAAYLSLGLIVLIATPFVRVLGSVVAFARERDGRYALITAVVFAVMCLSVALGRV
jgi:uncharacterized membrane protein